MSIPLDNLYHWVKNQTHHPLSLYVFRPHGSRKISNINNLDYQSSHSERSSPPVICNDQEPLNYDFYQWKLENFEDVWKDQFEHDQETKKIVIDVLESLNLHQKNLYMIPRLHFSYYDCCILLHSEKNSEDLIRYQQEGFVCVHYWSHGIVSRDWFRYAQHDNTLNQMKESTINFLVHARDWGGTREYRLKFLELLVDADLINQSKITFQSEVDGNSFEQHLFKNNNFQIQYDKLKDISTQSIPSWASATYDADDYNNCLMSIVLETIFDGNKIHLTEKICRALACGHPFILAAGPGSLKYLRHYGFKTFSEFIDESYDDEDDSLLRLQKIVKVMKNIQSLSVSHKTQLKEIANYNRRWFFSDQFHSMIANELQVNLDTAYVEMQNHIGTNCRKIRVAMNKRKTPSSDVLHFNKDALSWIRKNRRVKKISK
jgi:hypothetical protein